MEEFILRNWTLPKKMSLVNSFASQSVKTFKNNSHSKTSYESNGIRRLRGGSQFFLCANRQLLQLHNRPKLQNVEGAGKTWRKVQQFSARKGEKQQI